MKKFKLIFYPIYIIVIGIVFYYSIDMLSNMDEYLSRLFKSISQVPKYTLSIFLTLGSLMIIEITLENIHIVSLIKRAQKAEKEVLVLKAKLYDASQQTPTLDGWGDEVKQEDASSENEQPLEENNEEESKEEI